MTLTFCAIGAEPVASDTTDTQPEAVADDITAVTVTCDTDSLARELDMLRVRYINNILFRQYDRHINTGGLAEYDRIADDGIRQQFAEIADMLNYYPQANEELLSFMREIQQDRRRTDIAGAKIWGEESLRRLNGLEVTERINGRVFSLMYLKQVVNELRERLVSSTHGSVTDLSDIIRGMSSNARSGIAAMRRDNDFNITGHTDITPIGDMAAGRPKAADLADDKPDPAVPDSVAAVTDECAAKRAAVVMQTDRLGLKYAGLILTMPFDRGMVDSALARLSAVSDTAVAKQGVTTAAALNYYAAANEDITRFIDIITRDAAENGKEYDETWYIKAMRQLHDMPAYKRIVEGTQHPIPFLANILIGIDDRLNRARKQHVAPVRLRFDDYIREMRPIG